MTTPLEAQELAKRLREDADYIIEYVGFVGSNERIARNLLEAATALERPVNTGQGEAEFKRADMAWSQAVQELKSHEDCLRAALAAARTPLASVEGVDYDRGRRDVLNAILALNPKAAQRLHMVSGGTEETFANHDGRLPFDVVFWVTEVAEQLGIEPKGGE